MSDNVARYPLPRVRRAAASFATGWNRIGDQTAFYVKSIASTRDAVLYYKGEIARLIAQMSLGVGALAVIGGTVVIIILLTGSVGGLVAIQGYTSLGSIGIEALTGFFSAYVQVRFSTPAIAAIGLAVTVGAGATAQLGAMRINEEIDALEVMAVRAIAYVVSTRLIAGVIVVIPLFCMATITATAFTRFLVIFVYGQSSGVYDHYFNTFLQPFDIFASFLEAVVMGLVIMLVHTYYGFNASGGPAGVGEAVGRAVRASLVAAVSVALVIALATYGESGNFHLSG
jgi:phospholipid/cholesterol/gamma-HCH transport system permease protein